MGSSLPPRSRRPGLSTFRRPPWAGVRPPNPPNAAPAAPAPSGHDAPPDAPAPAGARIIPLPTAPNGRRRPAMPTTTPRFVSLRHNPRSVAASTPKRRLATLAPRPLSGSEDSSKTGGPKSRPPAPASRGRGARSALSTLRDPSQPVAQRTVQAAGDLAQDVGARAIQSLSGGVIPAKLANRALGHLREHKKGYGLALLAAAFAPIVAMFMAIVLVVILVVNISLTSTAAAATGDLNTTGITGLMPIQVQLLNAGADWTQQHRGQQVDGITVYAALPAAFLLADLLQESGGQRVPTPSTPIVWSQFAVCPTNQGGDGFECAQGSTVAMLANAQEPIPPSCESGSWWQAHGVDCGGAAGPAQIQTTNASGGGGSDTWASSVANSPLFTDIYTFMRSQVGGYSWPQTPNPWAFGYAVAAQVTVLLDKEQVAVPGQAASACASAGQAEAPSLECLEWIAAYYNGSEFSTGIAPGSYGYSVGQLYLGLQTYATQSSFGLSETISGIESGAQQVILTAAQAQLGVPYVWGGETPGAAFDCSGLTAYVYSLVGLGLPHGSVMQQQIAQQDGVFIPSPNPSGPLDASQLADFEAQLAPGDLVFYDVPADGSAQPGHVGIYVGGGEMIDAPATGQVVSVQPIFNYPGAWPTGGAAFWKVVAQT